MMARCPPVEEIASGRGRVRPLAAACCPKVGSWRLGFSQGVKFHFLKLHVLLQKASRCPDEVSDPVAALFRPWWP